MGEKEELTFGFIKLTDMAPIAIAYENGYFEDEGIYVTIEAQDQRSRQTLDLAWLQLLGNNSLNNGHLRLPIVRSRGAGPKKHQCQ